MTNLLSPSKLSFTFLHEYRGDLARTSIIIIKSVPLTYKDYSLENYWHGMNVILKGIEQCIPTNLYIASFLLTSRRQVIPFRFILKKNGKRTERIRHSHIQGEKLRRNNEWEGVWREKVKPLAQAAARRGGLTIPLYFSQGLRWHLTFGM